MLLSLLLFFNYFKRRLKLARRFHRKLPVKCNFQRTFTTYSLKELEHVRKKHSKVSADNKKKSDHISHFFSQNMEVLFYVPSLEEICCFLGNKKYRTK